MQPCVTGPKGIRHMGRIEIHKGGDHRQEKRGGSHQEPRKLDSFFVHSSSLDSPRTLFPKSLCLEKPDSPTRPEV